MSNVLRLLSFELEPNVNIICATWPRPMQNFATGHMYCVIKEAVRSGCTAKTFNRDGDFTFSWFWYLVTNMIKQYRDINPEASPS
jgi:hypothetical protein